MQFVSACCELGRAPQGCHSSHSLELRTRSWSSCLGVPDCLHWLWGGAPCEECTIRGIAFDGTATTSARPAIDSPTPRWLAGRATPGRVLDAGTTTVDALRSAGARTPMSGEQHPESAGGQEPGAPRPLVLVDGAEVKREETL